MPHGYTSGLPLALWSESIIKHMQTLYPHHLKGLSRRDFLKLSGAALLSLFLSPFDFQSTTQQGNHNFEAELSSGRILENKVTLYDRPSFSGKVLKMYWKDLVLPITAVTIGDSEPAHNRIWYEINHEGYVHSGSVQPVKVSLNPILDMIPDTGQLVEVTVPYTDAVWSPWRPGSTAYRLYYGTTYWVKKVVVDEKGKFWYRILDDHWGYYYYADATHLKPITPNELRPFSSSVKPEEKRLEVHLSEQVVVAYEADSPVFITRVSTGARFSDGDFRTQRGRFMTNRKRPSRHMTTGDHAAPNSYDLPGVPWVCYLTRSGVSFHGTFWHNDFGKPRSHGCINCSIPAARWIYRWTDPVVPHDKEYLSDKIGTQVDVI